MTTSAKKPPAKRSTRKTSAAARLEAQRAAGQAAEEALAAESGEAAGNEESVAPASGTTISAGVPEFSDSSPNLPVPRAAAPLVAQAVGGGDFAVVAGGRGQGGHMLALSDLPEPVTVDDASLPLSEGDEYILRQAVRGIEQLSTAWEVAALSCENIRARQLHLRRGYISIEAFLEVETEGKLTKDQFYSLCRAWQTQAQFSLAYSEPAVLGRPNTGLLVPPQLDQTAYEAFAPAAAAHGSQGLATVYEAVVEETGKAKPPVRAAKAAASRVAKLPPGASQEEIREAARMGVRAVAPKPRVLRATPVVVTTTDQDRPGEVAELQHLVRQAQGIVSEAEALEPFPTRTRVAAVITAARQGSGDEAKAALDGLASRYRAAADTLKKLAGDAEDLYDMVETMRRT